MSRAQGDNYRTHTNHELNAYRARLDAKLRKLADHKEKWYRIGEGWVHVEEKNRMFNPISDWKWEGWEIQAHEYWIKVFLGECVAIRDGEPRVIGLAQIIKVIDDDRAAANTFLQEVAAPIARNLKNWIPDEANNRVFFDYPGRKPKATIPSHNMAEEITHRCADGRLICRIPKAFNPDFAIALTSLRVERFTNIVHAHPQFPNDAAALNIYNRDTFARTDNKGLPVVGGSWVIPERILSLTWHQKFLCALGVGKGRRDSGEPQCRS